MQLMDTCSKLFWISPEDISENFDEFHCGKNFKFENFGEFQM